MVNTVKLCYSRILLSIKASKATLGIQILKRKHGTMSGQFMELQEPLFGKDFVGVK